ncbi:DegT/DnrJ/EryC1/StrS family aminotransferase [Roseiconus lacunae]|uniref:DegT/DnrJ/EryC1/StrS family aminotransferase n=1 Tax=Roseiconus lacunae TaxID=2605694 RepID=UPI00190F227D|nr:DegT/DnrJ/EryC1/StrS family aminotransferase [Roseiconus lacunae]
MAKHKDAMHKFQNTRDAAILEAEGDNIVLFHPVVSEKAIQNVTKVLRSRWVGEGPRVREFEKAFERELSIKGEAVAVGSCTDALHLSYVLSNIQPDDEVIVPVFTCTATNIPLLYLNARIRFADVEPDTLNIDFNHVRTLVSERTKAIVCVHYGGLCCDMSQLVRLANELEVPLIEDAAQGIGAVQNGIPVGSFGAFSAFSFQAVKHFTTGDGGMLVLRNEQLADRARRMRWFGIDRSAKQNGTWGNDITELGYKYQMTDIAAAMGLAGLEELKSRIQHRRNLLRQYFDSLSGIDGIRLLGKNRPECENAAWLCTAMVEGREAFQQLLRAQGVESGQVHYRNDRYSIFNRFRDTETPNMDAVEGKYVCLPLHDAMSSEQVDRVCSLIRKGW